MRKGHIVLLGFGMQGKAALYDLINNYDVSQITVADTDPHLESHLRSYPRTLVTGHYLDANDESALETIMKNADIVIEALPGIFTFPVCKIAAKLGVNLVSSMYMLNPAEQNAVKISNLKQEINNIDLVARENGATILTEFGLDPGIDLVLGVQALKELDEVEEFYSYGAGLPVLEAADNPLKYKFSWSVLGVMKSYCRPAWLISDNKVVEIDPHEMFAPQNKHILDLEEMDAPLECFPNGNCVKYAEAFGIRDSIKEMGRYTCRWPGHGTFWETLVKCEFLNENPVRIGDTEVSPLDFTASLLESQKQFRFAEHEQDITFIRIDVRGKSKGKKKQIIYQLIDRRDLETGLTSMQRTVGFTMSLGARFILEGKIKKAGLVSPLEVPFDLLIPELKKYNIHISRQELQRE